MMRRMVACAAVSVIVAGCVTDQDLLPGVYRTPDERFENLPGYDFAPHYVDFEGDRKSTRLNSSH